MFLTLDTKFDFERIKFYEEKIRNTPIKHQAKKIINIFKNKYENNIYLPTIFFPWLGYFNMIHNCDDFIFLDDVQYNRRSWQNRTYIKSYNSNKRQWLSMSLKVSSRELNINEAYLIQENLKYFRDQLYQNYKRAKFFDKYYNIFNEVLSKNINADLSSLNINIIEKICSILKIDLKYKLSSSFNTNKKRKLNIRFIK